MRQEELYENFENPSDLLDVYCYYMYGHFDWKQIPDPEKKGNIVIVFNKNATVIRDMESEEAL